MLNYGFLLCNIKERKTMKKCVFVLAVGIILSNSLVQAAWFRGRGMAIEEVQNIASSFIKARKGAKGNKDFKAYKKAMGRYKREVSAYLSKNQSSLDNLREVLEREIRSDKALKKLDEWEKKNKSSMMSVKKSAREFVVAYKKLEKIKEYQVFRCAKKAFREAVLRFVDQNGKKGWNMLIRDKALKDMGKKIIRKIEEWRKKNE